MNTIVTEMTEEGETAVDVYQKMSNSRILFIIGDIDDNMASDICATLLLKDNEDPGKKITLFINSRGGDLRAVLAIYDMIMFIDSPVETICIGSAMKEAAIILAAGSKNMRFATKHSVICFGQLVNNLVQVSDLTNAQLLLAHTTSDNKRMMNIISKLTNKPLKKVMVDFQRLVFMDSNQAKKYGFIDNIVIFNNREVSKHE